MSHAEGGAWGSNLSPKSVTYYLNVNLIVFVQNDLIFVIFSLYFCHYITRLGGRNFLMGREIPSRPSYYLLTHTLHALM